MSSESSTDSSSEEDVASDIENDGDSQGSSSPKEVQETTLKHLLGLSKTTCTVAYKTSKIVNRLARGI